MNGRAANLFYALIKARDMNQKYFSRLNFIFNIAQNLEGFLFALSQERFLRHLTGNELQTEVKNWGGNIWKLSENKSKNDLCTRKIAH